MKFRIMVKSPDAISESISENVGDEAQRKEMNDAAQSWFIYGEYLVVEIDTIADTCIVIKPREAGNILV